jgi:hypothetical protein
MVRGSEGSAAEIAIRTRELGPADEDLTEIPEFISHNPPFRKGTVYGTKQQHAA